MGSVGFQGSHIINTADSLNIFQLRCLNNIPKLEEISRSHLCISLRSLNWITSSSPQLLKIGNLITFHKSKGVNWENLHTSLFLWLFPTPPPLPLVIIYFIFLCIFWNFFMQIQANMSVIPYCPLYIRCIRPNSVPCFFH